jgi:nicotinamide phosphoribosyltransferase
MPFRVPPQHTKDFYKAGHVFQYPKGVTKIFSNWTARASKVPGVSHTVNFGLTAALKDLIADWNELFFDQDWEIINRDYKDFMRETLGVQDFDTQHLYDLWHHDSLPLDVYALPEGDLVPIGVPSLVIVNTRPWAYWLPNFLETRLSNKLWKATTSATTARRFREIFVKWARVAGETDLGFVNYQGHDFSYRGMSGDEDAYLSGMGHLTQFSGTDTEPAILAARHYYGAKLSVGGSVPATEHSVMSAGQPAGELETFRRLLTEVYPSGVLSVVSDTWDLWRVLTEYVPSLKDIILEREGKLVIRPDSGDPVKICVGDGDLVFENHGYKTKQGVHPGCFGAVKLLADALGTTPNTKGFEMINKGGVIYGDGISPERAEAILSGIMIKNLHPYNMVFGIGSYTYTYTTRDTYGFAMKATACEQNGEIVPMFKDPITDDGCKKSAKGIPIVHGDSTSGYTMTESSNPRDLDTCAFDKVMSDGKLLIDPSFESIRRLARKGLE